MTQWLVEEAVFGRLEAEEARARARVESFGAEEAAPTDPVMAAGNRLFAEAQAALGGGR